MDTIELSRKYGSHPVARAIVSCIPYVGGTLEETKVDLDFLEQPAFYDLLINAIPVALRIRSEEIQIAIADMIKESLIHPEKIDTIEGLVNDLSGFREKDLVLFRTLSRLFDDRAMITPCNVYDDSPSIWMEVNEADRYMSRFVNMLLLDYPRNVLSGVGKIEYHATPLFFQLKTSMGLQMLPLHTVVSDTVIYPDKVRLNCYYRNYSFLKDIDELNGISLLQNNSKGKL